MEAPLISGRLIDNEEYGDVFKKNKEATKCCLLIL
jgi:hypothetical protein